MLRNGQAVDTPAAGEETPEKAAAPGASGQGESPSGATPSSDSSPSQRSGNDWFREAFNAQRYGFTRSRPEAPAGGDESTEAESKGEGADKPVRASAEGKDASKPDDKAEPTAEPQATPGNDKASLSLTHEELERRIQAETDRRLDKWQREEAARRKAEERRRLRDKDPYAYAQQEKEDEEKREALERELANAHRMTISTVETYDKSVLDPLMRLVPDKQRAEILSNISPGIAGRGQAAEKALKVLQDRFKSEGIAEAKKSLMQDQAFIKEVLARYGGGRVEPDTIPAAAAPAARTVNVNDSLRQAARFVRYRA